MPLHLISVPVLLVALALPATAAAKSRDAARFAAFAAHARATGTLSFTMHFEGDKDTCVQAGTCGVSGTVSARLTLDPNRPLHVGSKLVVLPVRGTATARVRDTVAGRECRDRARVRAAGLTYVGDSHGLLLRPTAAPGDDPFDTHCRGPLLGDLGTAALASGRLRNIVTSIGALRLSINAERLAGAHGFSTTVRSAGRIRLTKKR